MFQCNELISGFAIHKKTIKSKRNFLTMRIEKIISNALTHANDDSYILSIMVAQRSNQLAEGAEPLIKVDKNKVKLTDIALMEIAEGVIELESVIEND